MAYTYYERTVTMKMEACCVAVFVVLIGVLESEAGLIHHYPFDTDASDAAGTFIGQRGLCPHTAERREHT